MEIHEINVLCLKIKKELHEEMAKVLTTCDLGMRMNGFISIRIELSNRQFGITHYNWCPPPYDFIKLNIDES